METGTETKPKKSHRHFATHPKAGPGRGHKKAVPAIGQMFAEDMRKAYEQPELPDDTLGVKTARALFKADYGKFMTIYTKLVGNSPSLAAAATVGPNEEKVSDLIDKLLSEWDRQNADK